MGVASAALQRSNGALCDLEHRRLYACWVECAAAKLRIRRDERKAQGPCRSGGLVREVCASTLRNTR